MRSMNIDPEGDFNETDALVPSNRGSKSEVQTYFGIIRKSILALDPPTSLEIFDSRKLLKVSLHRHFCLCFVGYTFSMEYQARHGVDSQL